MTNINNIFPGVNFSNKIQKQIAAIEADEVKLIELERKATSQISASDIQINDKDDDAAIQKKIDAAASEIIKAGDDARKLRIAIELKEKRMFMSVPSEVRDEIKQAGIKSEDFRVKNEKVFARIIELKAELGKLEEESRDLCSKRSYFSQKSSDLQSRLYEFENPEDNDHITGDERIPNPLSEAELIERQQRLNEKTAREMSRQPSEEDSPIRIIPNDLSEVQRLERQRKAQGYIDFIQ